jgi:hypothetical protein
MLQATSLAGQPICARLARRAISFHYLCGERDASFAPSRALAATYYSSCRTQRAPGKPRGGVACLAQFCELTEGHFYDLS